MMIDEVVDIGVDYFMIGSSGCGPLSAKSQSFTLQI